MSRSPDRGQTEPLAALVAVVAVGLGLSLYAGALDAELTGVPDRNLAESASERVESAVAPAGVARPSRVSDGQAAGPDGYRTNVTIAVEGESRDAGPPTPERADTETVRVAVRTGPATVRSGELHVRVWT